MIWNKLTEKRPHAYKTGMYDGKKSDKVLVADEFGNYYIAEMYEGFMDGSEFCDFYDTRDFEVKNVEYWTEIKKKTPMKKEQIIFTKMLWFSIGFTLAIVLMYSIVADGKL